MNQTLIKYNSLFKQTDLSTNRIYLEDMIKNILTTKEDTSFVSKTQYFNQNAKEEHSIKMPSLSRISQIQESQQQQETKMQ